jgi:phosphoglycolate phosphatase
MKTDRWHTLFWDLDGTITDPRRGIIDSYVAFLKESSVNVPPESELLWVIGPPLRECMSTLLGTTDPSAIEAAVSRYRYWYVDQGLMYGDIPYEGIKDLFDDLKVAGYRMFVATAKAHTYARLILRHYGLEHYFEEIHGSELDGTRSDKSDLLRWMTERHHIEANSQVLMIGDRKHDAIAAKKNNLSSLGVGYGYGSRDELENSGVDIYCETLADLRAELIIANSAAPGISTKI